MSPNATTVPFHSRPVGTPHFGSRSIERTKRKFDIRMSYRSYRLTIKTESWLSRETAEVQVHIKNLKVTLKNHVCNRKEPMKLFDFLNRFVNQTKMLNNSEAQDVIALQTFLEDPANTQFCINLSGASRNGGIHFWAEAIICIQIQFRYV